jgi:hypothetical protein
MVVRTKRSDGGHTRGRGRLLFQFFVKFSRPRPKKGQLVGKSGQLAHPGGLAHRRQSVSPGVPTGGSTSPAAPKRSGQLARVLSAGPGQLAHLGEPTPRRQRVSPGVPTGGPHHLRPDSGSTGRPLSPPSAESTGRDILPSAISQLAQMIKGPSTVN